jgi:predicted nucleic acid-binding protein
VTARVALDSSVVASALIQGDLFQPQARAIMKRVFDGEYSAVSSIILPVEVCGSISRRAGETAALMARRQLLRWEEMGLMRFAELTQRRKDEAMELAIKRRLKGMDAIILQVAHESRCTLITFDGELASRARGVVKVLSHRDFPTKA